MLTVIAPTAGCVCLRLAVPPLYVAFDKPVPWTPTADNDPAFFKRLPPSTQFFNALINAKFNRLAATRMSVPFRSRRAKLDTSFIDDGSYRVTRHIVVPPVAPLNLPVDVGAAVAIAVGEAPPSALGLPAAVLGPAAGSTSAAGGSTASGAGHGRGASTSTAGTLLGDSSHGHQASGGSSSGVGSSRSAGRGRGGAGGAHHGMGQLGGGTGPSRRGYRIPNTNIVLLRKPNRTKASSSRRGDRGGHRTGAGSSSSGSGHHGHRHAPSSFGSGPSPAAALSTPAALGAGGVPERLRRGGGGATPADGATAAGAGSSPGLLARGLSSRDLLRSMPNVALPSASYSHQHRRGESTTTAGTSPRAGGVESSARPRSTSNFGTPTVAGAAAVAPLAGLAPQPLALAGSVPSSSPAAALVGAVSTSAQLGLRASTTRASMSAFPRLHSDAYSSQYGFGSTAAAAAGGAQKPPLAGGATGGGAKY